MIFNDVDWDFVNWKRIIIIMAAVGVLVGSVFAIYKITSPVVETNANDKALLSFVINGTGYFEPGTYAYPDVTVGDTLVFGAQLSDGLSGADAYFYVNGASVGFDSTDDTGLATKTYFVPTPGAYSFYADVVHP